jgi:hypothetical protein
VNSLHWANQQLTLWVAQGKFPKPKALSMTIKVWRMKDVISWIDQQCDEESNHAKTSTRFEPYPKNNEQLTLLIDCQLWLSLFCGAFISTCQDIHLLNQDEKKAVIQWLDGLDKWTHALTSDDESLKVWTIARAR